MPKKRLILKSVLCGKWLEDKEYGIWIKLRMEF